jgi:NAD(P)-dependent dehydrogenase (short-subunit alcohol dehydrogenase family)
VQVTSKRLLADVPVAEIQSAVSCNVLGSLLGSRAAVQLMREQQGAKQGPPEFHILNFGFTEFGAKNTKSATTHKASKTSLLWLTRALLEELREAGEEKKASEKLARLCTLMRVTVDVKTATKHKATHIMPHVVHACTAGRAQESR